MPASPSIARHFGLDWLRIGAFALLILYHLGLYFGPTPWVVKSPQTFHWVALVSAAVTPWRLTLLFAVSGYATAAMMERHRSLGHFLKERTRRLLVPLAFGLLVIVPPQEWVRFELVGVDRPYGAFLTQDFFSFRWMAGVFLPNFEHLWFLPTLLGFTLLTTLASAAFPGWRERATPAIAWLGRGNRMLIVPLAALLALLFVCSKVLHLWWLIEYLDYLPAFLFGIAYAHSPEIRRSLARLFPQALAICLAALAVILEVKLKLLGEFPYLQDTGELAAEYVMSWAMMPVLFHLADRLRGRDHPLRAVLSAAVFPAYVVHQTIIVLVGWQLAAHGVVGLPAFAVMLAAVVSGCFAAWWLAKTSPALGELLGMPHKARLAAPRLASAA